MLSLPFTPMVSSAPTSVFVTSLWMMTCQSNFAILLDQKSMILSPWCRWRKCIPLISFFATDFQDQHICSWIFDIWNLHWYTPICWPWWWWNWEEIYCTAFSEFSKCLLSGYHIQMVEIAILLCWSTEVQYWKWCIDHEYVTQYNSTASIYILWVKEVQEC